MLIRSLWTDYGPQAGDSHTPSMLIAWDEGCLEENPEGWDEAVEKAKAQFDDRATREFRIIDIEVPGLWDAACAQFMPARVKGRMAQGDN